ncbi:hypothetical protein ACYSNM_07890 [Myroides sp. LJL116]
MDTHFCRKADPESKGKIENVVKYVKQNFLYNRMFTTLNDLNKAALLWLERTANANEHGTTKKSPQDEFVIEKEFLFPWYALELLVKAQYPSYTVHKDNKISYKSNLYSLPIGTYQGPQTKVLVKIDNEYLVLLTLEEQEICRHVLSALRGQKIIARNHKRDLRYTLEQMMESFVKS